MNDISSGGKSDDDKEFDMLAEGSSECIFRLERILFLIGIDKIGRLSQFKKPKVSDRIYYSYKKQKIQTDKGKSSAGKGSRNFGKLAVLKDMTLDVFFEVCMFLFHGNSCD